MKTNNTLLTPESQIQKTTQKSKPNFHGFTLVELIVVITILVILGTIGFMSLSGYSGSARDSSRISDLNNIAKALDITYQKTNSYPLPDNYFNITYSGGNVWHQGNVSEGVIAILNNGGGLKLSKKPTDPLTTSKEYTYSKLSYGYAYQIKANWEGETVASYSPHSAEGDESFFNQAQASTGNPTITYVKGNYNGVVAKTQTGNLIYILAVPSILTSTGVTYLSSIDMGTPANVLSGTLFIHGGSNTTGVSYNPKLIYASGSLPKTQAEQILFASGIATAYSGTPLATQSSIQPFTMALASNDTTALASLGGGVIVSTLGGVAASAPSGGGGGGGGASLYTNLDGSSTAYIPDSANDVGRFTFSASDAVVTDNITGLKWQSFSGSAPGSKNWATAVAYCTGLSVPGVTGSWRLPDNTEMLSIVDFSSATSFNSSYFVGAGVFHTSASLEGMSTFSWFFDGGSASSGLNAKTTSRPTRCVLGSKSPKLPWQGTANGTYNATYHVGAASAGESRFTFSNGDAVVNDSVTGLKWQSSSGTTSTSTGFTNAISYCSGLVLAGFSDWRLPTIKELSSIVDFSKSTPAANTSYFTSVGGSYYWAITPDLTFPTYGLTLSVDAGSIVANDKTVSYPVRCVR